MRLIKSLYFPVIIFFLMSFRNNGADDIQDYSWSLVKIYDHGFEEDVSSCGLFIGFTDSVLAMNDGCNWHGGIYRTNKDTLTIKITVSTERDCRGNEPCYRLRLSEKNTFVVRNDSLQIISLKKKQVFVFARGERWKRN